MVAAFDRTFDYRKWTVAFRAIRRGADFIATNADATYPGDEGEIPDCGGVIAALEASTSVPVRAVLGKPSQDFLAVALRRLGVGAAQTLVVGDRLQTDIAMGAAGDVDTALTLTGVTTAADLQRSEIRPTYVLPTLGGLIAEEVEQGKADVQRPR